MKPGKWRIVNAFSIFLCGFESDKIEDGTKQFTQWIDIQVDENMEVHRVPLCDLDEVEKSELQDVVMKYARERQDACFKKCLQKFKEELDKLAIQMPMVMFDKWSAKLISDMDVSTIRMPCPCGYKYRTRKKEKKVHQKGRVGRGICENKTCEFARVLGRSRRNLFYWPRCPTCLTHRRPPCLCVPEKH